MRRPGVTRMGALVATALVAAGVGIVSVDRARDQLVAIETCDAAHAGDHPTALAVSHGHAGPNTAGREIASCRCLSLIATGASEACSDLVAGILDDPDSGDWAPDAPLSVHLVQTWRDAGRVRGAAELARRAGRRHPGDPDLFHLELATRGSLEDGTGVLQELIARIPERGEAGARMRVSLAQYHLRAGDPRQALAALGERPPPGSSTSRGLWHDTRGIASAYADDLAATRNAYASWAHDGGDPAELAARYAIALSMAGLQDPDAPVLARLRRAAATSESLDPTLQETLAIRLILTLVNAGQLDEALATHDQQGQRVPLAGLRREELERAVRHRELANTPPEARRGRLRFEIGERGGSLWLSPEPDAPVDADYEPIPVPASGEIRVERSAGLAPQRWVLRGAQGETRGSGTIAPRPGRSVDVVVRSNPSAIRSDPGFRADRHSADGHRRVALMLLDCGDWRITQYLRARGELPVIDRLAREGQRAVLHSDPPLTAAALEALMWPGRRTGASFVGLMHRMGVELAGLSSIGNNPFAALAWLMPESDDLFSVLGDGERSAANLLLAHGGIRAGRHGEVTGPGGRRRMVPLGAAERDLSATERGRFAAFAGRLPERDAVHVRTIAAELDVAATLAADRSIDFLAIRIEPLDILTHAHFAETVADGQDDAVGLLFDVYRYVDWRLAEVSDALDADDVLIVMSDHGIRTSMEHSQDAMFIAHGGDVPRGRTAGRPELRGVSRAVADLLGTTTSWPDGGVAPWARSLAHGGVGGAGE